MFSRLESLHKTRLGLALCMLLSVGQAFGQFTTVINVPPELAPEEIGSDTQLNLFETDEPLRSFSAGAFDGSSTNVELNIFGGEILNGLSANRGSTVNFSGGFLHRVYAGEGSIVNLTGGSLGRSFSASSGSQINLYGGEFQLNGVPISGLNQVGDLLGLDLPEDSVLSGTVADGSPFAISSFNYNRIDDGTITLIATELPPLSKTLFVAPNDPIPSGIGAGQTLIVEEGGVIESDFNAIGGSTVNIVGGLIGRRFSAIGAQVSVSGGRIEADFIAMGSTVNISGGTVGSGFSLRYEEFRAQDSVVNISGGKIGGLNTYDSVVNISGGTTNAVIARDNSVVNLFGGTISNLGAEDSEVNIYAGLVGSNILGRRTGGTAGSGSLFNIYGGSLGERFIADDGSVVNLFGNSRTLGGGVVPFNYIVIRRPSGSIGQNFHAKSGSEVNVAGGSIGYGFQALPESNIQVFGGEYRLDGVPIEGLGILGSSLPFNLPEGSVLSGTLSDGTPFAFSELARGKISDDTLTLHAASLPRIGPATIVASRDRVPLGIRTGQTLVVEDGALVDAQFQAGRGSSVVINGGEVGIGLVAVGAQVTLTDGVIRQSFHALDGSKVDISGGSVSSNFIASGNSEVNVSGGKIWSYFEARNSRVNVSGGSIGAFQANDSEVNISGGLVSGSFHADNSVVNLSGGSVNGINARNGSIANISGGSIESAGAYDDTSLVNITGGLVGGFFAFEGGAINISGGSIGNSPKIGSDSHLNISGGEFRLDATPLAGLDTVGNALALDVPLGSTLSGTLADGTPFALSIGKTPAIADGALTLTAASLPPISPTTLVLPHDPAPRGVRAGQTLIVEEGGELGNLFKAGWDSKVVVEGGVVGEKFGATGAQVKISDGSIGNSFQVNRSEVTISGGTVGHFFSASNSSRVNISGGLVLGNFSAVGDSVANISGDAVIGSTSIGSGSVANISGDAVIGRMSVSSGSVANISGGTVSRYLRATDSIVNISGGTIGPNSSATNSELSISGGMLGNSFHAEDGSHVNISGGFIGDNFLSLHGSRVSITGGTIGSKFVSYSGSQVNITGGEFHFNGKPLTGLDVIGNILPLNLLEGSILSGTLADGAPFAFSSNDNDRFHEGVLTLTAARLPPVGPASIVVPRDPAPLGIRSGQTLVVVDGGTLGNNFKAGVGSKVTFNGGEVGDKFESVGTQVSINSGTIGSKFQAYSTEVTISGGTVGDYFGAFVDSKVSISSGEFGKGFHAGKGSEVNLSGGSFGPGFNALKGSNLTITGGDFRLNGVPIQRLHSVGDTRAIPLNKDHVLSGTFADGTPFAFSSYHSDSLPGATKLVNAELPPVGPAVITLPNDSAPLGIRTGQTLVVEEGGIVPENFNAGWGSSIQIAGGHVGSNFQASGAQVAIRGGEIAEDFDAYNSVVDIRGGSIGKKFSANVGSVVNVSGGNFEGLFYANQDSVVNFSGGNFEGLFYANQDSVVNISGGEIGKSFRAKRGSEVNLFGTQFVLDRIDLTDTLALNSPLEIKRLETTLSGLLADGSPFHFDLAGRYIYRGEDIEGGVKLTITLVAAVPEPASALLLLPAALGTFLCRRRHA